MFQTSDAFVHYLNWSIKIAQMSGPKRGMKTRSPVILILLWSNFILS